VRLDDAPLRAVLATLDGARTLDAAAADAGYPVEVARAAVASLAAAALLVG